mgnify:FL=1
MVIITRNGREHEGDDQELKGPTDCILARGGRYSYHGIFHEALNLYRLLFNFHRFDCCVSFLRVAFETLLNSYIMQRTTNGLLI